MQVKDNLIDIFNNDIFSPDDLTKYNKIFDLFPFSIYWKNLDGKYLGVNRYSVEQMVFFKIDPFFNSKSVFMKSDYDFFNKKTADTFFENDKLILETPNKIQHFIEEIDLLSGETIEQISVKRCIFDKNLQPAVILGCTLNANRFRQPDKSLNEILKESLISELRKLIMRFMASKHGELCDEIANKLINLIHIQPHNKELRKLLLLTPRELQCLCLMLKGYTAKHIGGILNASYRTIEIHLGRVKEKLNLISKLDAYDWFWNVLSQL